jgi:hypothetical protein
MITVCSEHGTRFGTRCDPSPGIQGEFHHTLPNLQPSPPWPLPLPAVLELEPRDLSWNQSLSGRSGKPLFEVGDLAAVAGRAHVRLPGGIGDGGGGRLAGEALLSCITRSSGGVS